MIIENNYISFHKKNVNTNNAYTISRENICHVDIRVMRILTKVEDVYSFRLVALDIILIPIGVFVTGTGLFIISLAIIFLASFYGFVLLYLKA